MLKMHAENNPKIVSRKWPDPFAKCFKAIRIRIGIDLNAMTHDGIPKLCRNNHTE